MSDVTQILAQIDQGDPQAAEKLLPLVYDELRKLAAARMAHENPGQTLQATALVHEAYLRLVGPACRAGPGFTDDANSRSRPADGTYFSSRGHFFAAAAEAMRRILVENARRKRGPTAGGGHSRVDLSSGIAETAPPDLDLIALSESLEKLRQKDARAAELVKLRFFAGLNRQEAAEALGVSVPTADNDWAYAKGWLKADLAGTSGAG